MLGFVVISSRQSDMLCLRVISSRQSDMFGFVVVQALVVVDTHSSVWYLYAVCM